MCREFSYMVGKNRAEMLAEMRRLRAAHRDRHPTLRYFLRKDTVSGFVLIMIHNFW
jgi:hypothetical protein